MKKSFFAVVTVFTALLAGAVDYESLTWTGANQTISTDTHIGTLTVNAATTVLVEKNVTLTVDFLKGGNVVTKRGNGALIVKDIDPSYANSGLNIVKGAFKLGILGGGIAFPAVSSTPFYRVDAMCFVNSSVHKTHLENGNEVKYWQGIGDSGVSSFNYGGVRPHLVFDYLNGKPVVDFGPYTTVKAEGAALQWNSSSTSVGETFIVAADTDDVISGDLDGQWFFGANSGASSFYRGTGRRLARSRDDATYDPDFYNGLFEVDGEAASHDTVLGSGFHVIHQRAVSPKTMNAGVGFWCYHSHLSNTGFGGLRIAEAMVFNGTISDADAAKITAYLQSKWLDGPSTKTLGTLTVSGDAEIEMRDGDSLTVGTLTVNGELRKTGAGSLHANVLANSVGSVKTEDGSFTYGSTSPAVGDVRNRLDVPANGTVDASRVYAEGTFTKTGAGTLNAIVLAGGVTNITVSGGVFKVLADNGTLPDGARYRVDATLQNKLYLEAHGLSDGNIYAHYWEGVSGGSSFNSRSNWPWIRRDLLDGRNTVDFGSYYCANTMPGGYGAGFTWNDAAKTTDAKGVFVVFSDSDDVRESDVIAGQNVVGCYDHASFNRGPDHALLDGSINHERLNELRSNGVCEIDGVRTPYSTILPKGFHLVHMRLNAGSTKSLCAQSWGYSRYSSDANAAYYGGMKMAEGAIYTTDLTDAQVASATKYFLNKWFKQVKTGEYAFGTLTVSKDATLDLDGRLVTATGLCGGGTIAANAVTLSANGALNVDSDANGAEKITVTGTVTLPAAGTVHVNALLPRDSTEYTILEAGSLVGDVTGWTIDTANIPDRLTARVRKDGNSVILRVSGPGSVISIR